MVTLSTKPTPPVAGAHLPEGRMARTVSLELNPPSC